MRGGPSRRNLFFGVITAALGIISRPGATSAEALPASGKRPLRSYIEQVFREFRRYSGDGLPNEPTNAPLPIGDPQSGLNSPSKAQLRDILGAWSDGIDDAIEVTQSQRAIAVLAANNAQQYAADAAQTSGISVPVYESRTTAAATQIRSGVKRIYINYYSPVYNNPKTLVGGAHYRRVAYSDISKYPPSSYFRSSDRNLPNGAHDDANGGFWVLDESAVRPEMVGNLAHAETFQQSLTVAQILDATLIIDRETLVPLEGCVWPAGVYIAGNGKLKRAPGTVTGPMLSIKAAGIYRCSNVEFEDNGTSLQFGMIECSDGSATLEFRGVSAHNGYSGLWIKQCASLIDIGGDYYDASHPIYLGYNNINGVPTGRVARVNLIGTTGRNARPGGDGLKTVSNVVKLIAIGCRFLSNAQDGVDCFAGCDESEFIGCECSFNKVNGFDIKTGDQKTYANEIWGERRRINISHCIISDNTETGVKIDSIYPEPLLQDVSVTSNQILRNGHYGVFGRRTLCLQIVGNKFFGNAWNADAAYSVIYILANFSTSEHTYIHGNIIGNNGSSKKINAGINIISTKQCIITENTIGNDRSRIDPAYLDWGIVVDANSSAYVAGNIFGQINIFRVVIAPDTTIFGDNIGLPLLARGRVTFASSETFKSVIHGLLGRPASSQIRAYFAGPTRGLRSIAASSTSAETFVLTSYGDDAALAPTADCLVDWEADLRGVPLPHPTKY